jgi:hypothetical protein
MIIRATGMAWYRREDYPRILKIMADKLPATYDEWLRGAERGERELKSKGHIIVRAMIDPETFPFWCHTRGLKLDSQARTTFSAWVSAQQVKSTH